MLKAGGYRVFTVSSGAAALEFLKLHPIAAAIVDDADARYERPRGLAAVRSSATVRRRDCGDVLRRPA